MRARQMMLLVAGLAVVAGLVALALLIFRAREDRPPIIVKGGSIHFEGCADKNGRKKAWKKRQNGHWRPDHSKGEDVSKFHVEIVADNVGECDNPSVRECGTGIVVQVQYSQSGSAAPPPGKFEFNAELNDDLGKWEPTLSSDVALQPNGDFQLDYGGDGGTIAAAVNGRPCNPSAAMALRITPIP